MRTSIIIPTYNGAHRIIPALHSLEQQTKVPDEVIVVVDGSTDGTADLIHNTSLNIANLRVIEQANTGRGKVRNRGAAESTGELLIFMDDDIIAPENWVEEHINHHKKHPNSIVTGRLEDYNESIQNDFHQFKIWLHRKWTKTSVELNTPNESINVPYLTASNFSIRKETFDLLEGFDIRLRDVEDYDMATRALNAHIPLFFSQTAFAYNNDLDNSTCVQYIKRIRQYTNALETLVRLKPELYAGKMNYHNNAPHGIKGKVFSLLCRPWYISSIDAGNWKWLPQKIRYKFYDMVITANGSFFPKAVAL